MTDLSVLTSALASVKVAADLASALRGADLSLEKAELRMRLADITNSLADARMQMVDVQAQLIEKDQRIADLEQAIEVSDDLIYGNDAYYSKTTGEGPFCVHCWEAAHKRFRLIASSTNWMICPACTTKVLSHLAKRRPNTQSSCVVDEA